MIVRFFLFLLRCLFTLFKLLPNAWWRMLMGPGNAIQFENRTLQPRAQALIGLMSRNPPPETDEQLVPMRKTYDIAAKIMDQRPRKMERVEDITMDLDGRSLKARLYDAHNPASRKNLILYFHGGGFVIGGLESHDHFCRRLAQYSDCRVLAVDYRMGPENRFPAAPEDACDSWDWVQRNAEQLNINPGHVSVAGDSAGGNLAMVVGNYTADRPGGQRPKGLGLIYPAADAAMEDDRIEQLAELELILGEKVLTWFGERYRPDTGTPEEEILQDPRISPLRDREKVTGWPPSMLITCGFDPLRPSGEALLHYLEEKDLSVTYKEYTDLFHGFITMGSVFPETDELAMNLGRYLADPR